MGKLLLVQEDLGFGTVVVQDGFPFGVGFALLVSSLFEFDDHINSLETHLASPRLLGSAVPQPTWVRPDHPRSSVPDFVVRAGLQPVRSSGIQILSCDKLDTADHSDE